MVRQFLRFFLPVLGPALLVAWLHFAGTYSMVRDAAGIGLVSAAMIAVRFYRKRRLALGTNGSIWWTARSFLPAWRLGPSLAWALLCWVVLGSLDQLFESTPVSRQGMNVRVARDYQGLRVGLALSGGGYRAALVHAGVLNILARRGVPVTNLSTVSGGSIIGSFVAAGGNPRDFVQAVAGGRFRLSRDMLNFQNAARILASTQLPVLHVALWPFETFTTRSVQANLVDRVLLNGVNARGMQIPNAPLIMVCMTDLTYALAVGAMPDGLLLAGPTQKRFFKEGEALQLEGLNRLADRVAVSGGFPGVFPALKARATLVTFPWSILGKDRSETLSLTLADGGIRDNLGLTLLEAANDHARNPPDYRERLERIHTGSKVGG
jgi:predicted acylesterase/phospholipase RssA